MSKRHALSLPLMLLLCIICTSLQAQDSASLYSRIFNFPDKLFGSISSKTKGLEDKLTRQTEKYLTRLARKEKKLQKQLWKKDSTAAKETFGDIDARYAQLKSDLASPSSSSKLRNVYSGHMDSMKTALRFLDQNDLLKQTPQVQEQLKSVMSNYSQLQGKLNGTDQINKYLHQRQQHLKSQVERFGLTKQYRRFQKDVYYYR
jgi:hypothetical protein